MVQLLAAVVEARGLQRGCAFGVVLTMSLIDAFTYFMYDCVWKGSERSL